jgi:hypothetical protein
MWFLKKGEGRIYFQGKFYRVVIYIKCLGKLYLKQENWRESRYSALQYLNQEINTVASTPRKQRPSPSPLPPFVIP